MCCVVVSVEVKEAEEATSLCSCFEYVVGARGLKYKCGLIWSYERTLDKERNFREPAGTHSLRITNYVLHVRKNVIGTFRSIHENMWLFAWQTHNDRAKYIFFIYYLNYIDYLCPRFRLSFFSRMYTIRAEMLAKKRKDRDNQLRFPWRRPLSTDACVSRRSRCD